MKSYIYKFSTLIIALICFETQISAQSQPMMSQYFQNPFYINPAFAGLESGYRLNMDYSLKSNQNQGKMQNQFFSVDAQLKKSGLGLSFQNNENGDLSTKIAKIAYAYHVKLSEKAGLHFGLNSGLTQERYDIGLNEVNNPNDPLPVEFNDRKPIFNVDFGTVFTTDKFTFQLSISNLKKVINATDKNLLDQVYYTSASYKIQSEKSGNWEIEPIVSYSKSDYFNDRVDAGLRFSLLNDQFSVIGIYRSDKIISSGIAFKVLPTIVLQGSYNSGISNELNNSEMFALAFKVNFKGKSTEK